MQYSQRKRKRGFRIYYACVIVLFVLLAIIMVFPLYNVIMTSIATQTEIITSPLMLFPRNPTWNNYRFLMLDGQIGQSYVATTATTFVGTLLSIAFTLLLAYGLSKRDLPGGKLVHRILLISMFIDSGLIPYYVMVKNLGLMNSFWSSIIPSLISLWNYLVIRSFFLQLPPDMEEAAMIDGASYGRVFLQIVLPLSIPVVATFTLYYAVGYWNSWYNCMLFTNDSRLLLLQLYVYRFVQQAGLEYSGTAAAFRIQTGEMTMNIEGIKAASCVAAVVPILLVYPFLQKYFAKGIMLGAIKG